MHTELEQKCMLRGKNSSISGANQALWGKTQGKAEKTQGKNKKKLKEKLKNSLSGKAFLWYTVPFRE